MLNMEPIMPQARQGADSGGAKVRPSPMPAGMCPWQSVGEADAASACGRISGYDRYRVSRWVPTCGPPTVELRTLQGML